MVIGIAMATTSTIMPITTRSSMSVKARRGLWIDVAEAADVIVGSIRSVPARRDQDISILLAGNIGSTGALEIRKRVVGELVRVAAGRRLVHRRGWAHCCQSLRIWRRHDAWDVLRLLVL